MSDHRRPAAAPIRGKLAAVVLVFAVAFGVLPLARVIAQGTPAAAVSTLHELTMMQKGERSQTHVVNQDGRVVGTTGAAASDSQTFLRHDGAISDSGTLDGFTSGAWDITAPSHIAGAADVVGGSPRATHWEIDVVSTLGTLSGGWNRGVEPGTLFATPVAGATPVTATPASSGATHASASPIALPLATPATQAATPPCRDVMRNDFSGKTRDLLADCTTDRSIFVPEDWVFDGGGNTIFAVDPDDGRLTGGVIMVTSSSGTVRHVTIDGAGLTADCVVDRGQTAITGVIVRGASGEVSGVTVRNLARVLPATTEQPPVIVESVRASCGTGIAVLGHSASVNVNENVIENVGYVGVLVEIGQASISHTTIDRAADTGILAGLGAHVRISPGNQIRNANVGIQLEGEGTGGRVAGNTIESMTQISVAIIGGAQASVADNAIALGAVNAIAIEGATTKATIENNQLDDPGEVGINVYESSAEIRSNRVSGGRFGIAVSNGGKAQVIGNTVSHAGDTGIFVLQDGTTATIENNTVEDAASDGIWVEQGAHATIIGNTVTDAKSNGIIAVAGATVAISDENVVHGGERGIAIGGAGTTGAVTGNRVEGVALVGIMVADGATAPSVSNNVVSDASFGIVTFGAGTSASVTDNSVTELETTGYTVESGASAELRRNQVTHAGWGIVVTDVGTIATVSDTLVSGAEETGIEIGNGAQATIGAGNRVSGGSRGISVLHAGTSATVQGNDVSEVANQGISVLYGARATVSDNAIAGPATGVLIRDGGSGLVEGNTIRDVTNAGIIVDLSPATPAVATTVPTPVAPTATAAAEVEGAIRRNTVEGGQFGIVVKGAGSPITVEGNHVRSMETTGISIEDQALADLAGNTVADASTGINIARSGTSATLTGNRVTDTTERGIHVQLGADALLRKNTVTRAGTSGIVVAGSGTAATLEGNVVSNATETGIAVESAATVTIDKGNFISGGKWGISILSSGTSAEVRGNRVRNVTNQGISVLYGAQATVDGNTVEGGESGIYVRYPNSQAVITGNFVSAEDEGIYVWEGATAERIADNTVTGGRSGIVVTGAGTTAMVEANRVSDGSLEGIHIGSEASAGIRRNDVTKVGRSANSRGIFITGRATTATIEENTLTDIYGAGILFNQGAEGTISGNILTAMTNTGIRLIDADTKATVIGNTVRDARAIGIEARAGEFTIADNTIVTAAQVGIQVGPDADVEVMGNTFTGPGEQDIDHDGPYGIQVLRGASGAIIGNWVTNHGNANPERSACGIVIDAEAPKVVVSENLFPDPSNEVDMCDERPRLLTPALTPKAQPGTATPVAVTSPVPIASPGATPMPTATS